LLKRKCEIKAKSIYIVELSELCCVRARRENLYIMKLKKIKKKIEIIFLAFLKIKKKSNFSISLLLVTTATMPLINSSFHFSKNKITKKKR